MSVTSTCDRSSGWQSGMRADVCLAAMMPASRAVWSGSPFLIAPARICRSAARDIVIRPRATASRAVTALSETSTIRTRPARIRRARAVFPAHSLSPCARKNDSDSSETVRSTLFSLTSGGTCSAPGEKFEHGLDPGRDHGIDDGLRGVRGHGDDGNRDLHPAARPRGTRECRGSRTPLRDRCPIFSGVVSNSAAISNPSSRKPG